MFLMRLIASITAILVCVALLSSCGGSGGSNKTSLPTPITTLEEAKQHETWTIMVYMDADNDLETAAISNFNQMEQIGSVKDMRIVVQIDRIPGRSNACGDWTDTRRYLITRDSNMLEINSIRLDTMPLGELDMANQQTLRDFVQYAVNEFPADYYCLVIWNHGTGWEFRTFGSEPRYKYVLLDETNGTAMNITSIPQALSGSRLNVIAFDACLMQQLETAYELKDSADYMVGSATLAPSPGFEYYNILRRVRYNTTPQQLCAIMVEEYALQYPAPRNGITLSALDLRQIDEVANALDECARILYDNRVDYANALQDARMSSLNYSTAAGGTQRYSYDLKDYMSRCSAALPALNIAYMNLSNAIQSAVLYETHNPDTANAHGLGIYIPPPASYLSNYSNLKLAADTYWNEWLVGQLQ